MSIPPLNRRTKLLAEVQAQLRETEAENTRLREQLAQLSLDRRPEPTPAQPGPQKPRTMLQVGVEGDLFHPHPENPSCAQAGCVPAAQPVAPVPVPPPADDPPG